MSSSPTVLVTRPEEQSGDMLRILRNAGFPALALPLFSIKACHLENSKQQHVRNLHHFQKIIFISRNAVSYGMPVITDYWSQLPIALQWFAVGKATGAQLAAFGLHVHVPRLETSEGLLRLSALLTLRGENVLIVRGKGGRETLATELANRGAAVSYLEVYERLPQQYNLAEMEQVFSKDCQIIVLITSGSALDGLRNLMRIESIASVQLIVPSERLKGKARESGFMEPWLADGASDAAMLACLERQLMR